MFRRHYQKRSTNIVIVIFRLFLSVFMFAVLLGGVYTAYKHFSGLDPLKLDLQAVFNNVIAVRIPKQLTKQLTNKQPGLVSSAKPQGINPLFRFLLVADSHIDNSNLSKTINQAKEKYPDLKFIIGLGDFSEVGTEEELKKAKNVFDLAGLRYFLIPGDHDLWDSRNQSLVPTAYFKEVFGLNYQTFIFDEFKFLLLNNSDNYKGVEGEQLQWISSELEKAKIEEVKGIFVFAHEPFYHPSSEHTMGWVEKSLKSQAEVILFKFKEAGVKEVFAGDIHYFSQYSEPKTNIPMVTIGAVTTDRNPQAPRFAVVGVGADGTTKVEDIEIK